MSWGSFCERLSAKPRRATKEGQWVLGEPHCIYGKPRFYSIKIPPLGSKTPLPHTM